MPNTTIKSYIKNVGKSLLYSAESTIGVHMPILSSTVQTNSAAMKTGASYALDIIRRKRSGTALIKNLVNTYMQDLVEIKNNAFADLRTGQFKNVEREMNSMMDSMGLNDFDIDWGTDDYLNDDENTSEDSSTTSAIRNSTKVSEVGSNMRTRNIMDTIISSSEESSRVNIRANSRLNSLLLSSQSQMHVETTKLMNDTNSLLTSILQFHNNTIVSHMDKQLSFYDAVLGELREIKELTKGEGFGKDKYNQTKLSPMEEIFGHGGSFNLSAYAKQVKKNADDMLMMSGLGMMSAMSSMGGSPLQMIKASPLSFITDMLVSGLLPKSMKTAMSKLDTSLGGLFGNMVMRINEARDDFSRPGMSFVASLFGIDLDSKDKVNVGNYFKGAVPFSGKSEKALTEVIPTLLSHILTAVKGGDASNIPLYDYSSGKFTSRRSVITANDERIKYSKQSSMSDTRYGLRRSLGAMPGGDSQALLDDVDNFVEFLATYQGRYNPMKDTDVRALQAKGLKMNDPRLYDAIRAAFLSMPKSTQTGASWERVSSKSRTASTVRGIENEMSETGLAAAYNGLHDMFQSINPNSNNNRSTGPNNGNRNGPTPFVNTNTAHVPPAYMNNMAGIDLMNNHGSTFRSPFAHLYNNPNVVTDSQQGGTNSRASNTDSDIENLINTPFEAMRTTMAAFNQAEIAAPSAPNSSFFKSLLAEKSMTKRIKMLREKMGTPGQMMTGMIGKLDSMVYRIIYGTEDGKDDGDDGDDQPPNSGKGIIGRFSAIFNRAMERTTNWMDVNVLMPFHEKFFGENGLFTKLSKALEPTIRSLRVGVRARTSKFINYLLGEKKDGVYSGGMLSEFGNTFIDIARSAKSKFTGKSYTKTDGTVVVGDPEDSIFNHMKDYTSSIMESIKRGLFGEKEGYEDENGNIWYGPRQNNGIFSYIVNSVKETVGSIRGVFSNDTSGLSDENKKVIMDWSKELKGFLPKGLASGIVGAGAGLLLPGGPLLGGLLGATIAFASHSKKFREYLFGDEEAGTKGMIPKEYADAYKKYVPTTIAGGILGFGGGLLLPGGPMMGMMLGASLGFVKRSKGAQNFLFGNEETGSEGVVPKNIVNAYKKYFPSLIGGGVLGLLGSAILPGGPLLGITLGAALGFASKSKTAQEYLFGREADENGEGGSNGLLGKEIKKRMKQIVGGGVLGMAAGMILPGGPLLGLMAGSALGFASKSEKFKEFIFGKKDEDGNVVRKGIVSRLKKHAPGIAGMVLSSMGVLPGGPLVGMLIGSAIGLIGKTDRVQNMLFGRSTDDATGNETPNILKFIKKKFPAIVGGVLGLTGMLGFGPLTGILLGSAVSFATKSKRFQHFIFGKEDDNGDLKGGILPKMKKHFPAVAGSLLGLAGILPGGPIIGLLLGSLFGFVSKLKVFQNFIFGKDEPPQNNNNPPRQGIFSKLVSGVGKIGAGIGNAAVSAGGKIRSLFSRNGRNTSSEENSHADGLDRVPYDNYNATLHYGEMVVPARQSEMIRKTVKTRRSDKNNIVNSLPVDNTQLKGAPTTNVFRSMRRLLRGFTSNVKKKLMPKIQFMSNVVEDVSDRSSYDTTQLGLLHQIAVNTAMISGGGGLGGDKKSNDALSAITKLLPAIAAALGIGSAIKNFIDGDIENGLKSVKAVTKLVGSKVAKIGSKITGKATAVREEVVSTVKGVKSFGSKVINSKAAQAVMNSKPVQKVKIGIETVKDVVEDKFSTVKKFIKEMIEKIFNNKIIQKKLGQEAAQKTGKEILEKILKVFSKDVLSKYGGKLLAGIAKATGKVAAGASTLFLSEAVWGIWNAGTGAFEAARLFKINNDEVDWKMRVISSVMKTILGFGFNFIFQIINDILAEVTDFDLIRLMANTMYKFMSSEDKYNKLVLNQNEFKEELAAYNKENKKNLSLAQYNDLKNKTVAQKIGGGVKTAVNSVVKGAKWVGNKVVSGAKWLGSTVAGGAKSAFNYVLNGDIDSNGENLKWWQKGLNVMTLTPRLLGSGAKAIYEKVIPKDIRTAVETTVKNGVEKVKDVGKDALRFIFNGDVDSDGKNLKWWQKGLNAMTVGPKLLGAGAKTMYEKVVPESIRNAVEKVTDKVKGSMAKLASGAINIGKEALNFLFNAGMDDENTSGWQKITNIFTALPRLLSSLAQSAYETFVPEKVRDVIENGVNIIKSGANKVKEGASTAWDKITNFFGFGQGGSGVNYSNSYGTGTDPKVNGYIYYSQGDPRWGSKNYSAPGENTNLKRAGCGPTAAAMVLSTLTGQEITPAMTANYALAKNHKVKNSGTSHAFFSDIGKQYGVDFTQTSLSGNKASKQYLIDNLKAGYPTILVGTNPSSISGVSSPFTPSGHFVVATGIQGNNVLINDPISKTRSKAYNIDDITAYSNKAFVATKNGNPITMPDSLVGGSNNSTSSTMKSGGLLGALMPGLESILNNMDIAKVIQSGLAGILGLESTTSTDSVIGQEYDYTKVSRGAESGGSIRNLKMQPTEFINYLAPMAIKAYNKYGILPSLTIAQAALESGFGSRAIGNNLFGIKANSGWKGLRMTTSTNEEVGGVMVPSTAAFRDYMSIEEGVNDYAKMLATSSNYAKVKNATNYIDAINGLHGVYAPYATDSNYYSKLTNLTNKYNLDKFNNKDYIDEVMKKYNTAGSGNIGISGPPVASLSFGKGPSMSGAPSAKTYSDKLSIALDAFNNNNSGSKFEDKALNVLYAIAQGVQSLVGINGDTKELIDQYLSGADITSKKSNKTSVAILPVREGSTQSNPFLSGANNNNKVKKDNSMNAIASGVY